MHRLPNSAFARGSQVVEQIRHVTDRLQRRADSATGGSRRVGDYDTRGILAAQRIRVQGARCCQQAQTDRALKVKNVAGALAVTVDFKDLGKDNKKLTVQILRQDGSVEKTASVNRGETITTGVSAADLAAGTNWTIRLLNPERREVKGITFLATFKAN